MKDMSTDPFNRAFAKRLWRAMNAKGWNQAELILRAGKFHKISRQQISDYCNGRKVPGPKRAFAIAKALEIEIGDLLPTNKASIKVLSSVQVYDVGNGQARVQIDRVLPWQIASEIMTLVNDQATDIISDAKGVNDDGSNDRAGGRNISGRASNRSKVDRSS